MRKQSTAQSSYEFKTCPTCGNFVKKVHKYCGHCSQQLQTQCPQCGIWTLHLHKTCPECGGTLHGGGFTFEQKKLLSTLKQSADALYDRRLQSIQNIRSLTTERKRIIRRLVVLGALIGVMIDGAAMLAQSGIVGVAILLGIVVIFGSRMLSLPQILYRWASPGSLTWVRQEITTEQSAISSLVEKEEEMRAEIASLEYLGAEKEEAELENLAGEDGEREELNPLEDNFYQPVPGEEDLLSVSYQSVPEEGWLRRASKKRKKISFSWLKKTRV